MNTAPADTGALSRLRVALIGYGEVGRILARELRARGLASLSTFDRLFRHRQRRNATVPR
jgi:glutamyl-tRNA reductase